MLFAVAAVAAVAIIRLWLLPIVNSFWLDETLIVRTIRGGFSQVASNAAASLQSVGFCSVEWLVSRAWNASEIALRLPSIVAALASLYVYYRLGVEFIDREAGLIFASLYIMLPQVAFEVPNARPYSLALLAHAGALLWLLRWTRSGLLRHGLWWTLCAAAACHLQPLFVLGLGVEGFFVLWLLLKSTAIRPRDFAICGAVAVILLLPALSQAVAMSRQAALLSFVDRPSLGSVLPVIFPFYALGAAAIMAVITRLEGTPLRWTAMKDASNLNVLAALLLFASTFYLESDEFEKVLWGGAMYTLFTSGSENSPDR